MQHFYVNSIDELISKGMEAARKSLQKQHYFYASVFCGENPDEISIMIDGDFINMKAPCDLNSSAVMGILHKVSDKLLTVDSRTRLFTEGEGKNTVYKVEFPEYELLRIYEQYYLDYTAEEVSEICRDHIFAGSHAYKRPYRIYIFRHGVLSEWGEYGRLNKTPYKFGMFKKLKSYEAQYAFGKLVNKYSGYLYDFKNALVPISDKDFAIILTIKNDGDIYN